MKVSLSTWRCPPTSKKNTCFSAANTESDSREYTALAALKCWKYLWTLVWKILFQMGTNGDFFFSVLIYFHSSWCTTERMPNLLQLLHSISSSGGGMQVFQIKWIMYLFNRLWAAYWLSTDWVTLRKWGKSRKRRRLNQGHVCEKLCGQINVFWLNSCCLGHSGFTLDFRVFNFGPQFLQVKILPFESLLFYLAFFYFLY